MSDIARIHLHACARAMPAPAPRRSLQQLAWLLCIGSGAWGSQLVGAAAGITSLPEPVRLSGTATVNGVRMQLRVLQLEAQMPRVVAALESEWGKPLSVSGFVVSVPAGRVVFGRQRGPFHETLTLYPPGPRSPLTALLAVSDLRAAPSARPRAPFELPRSMQLLNVVEWGASQERAPTTYSARTRESPRTAVASLLQHAARAGWVRSSTPALQARAEEGAVGWARRGMHELTAVAVLARGGTAVTFHVTHVAGPAAPGAPRARLSP